MAQLPDVLKSTHFFGCSVEVQAPGNAQRVGILRRALAARNASVTVDLEAMATRQLDGCSGRDLQVLVDRAVHFQQQRNAPAIDADCFAAALVCADNSFVASASTYKDFHSTHALSFSYRHRHRCSCGRAILRQAFCRESAFRPPRPRWLRSAALLLPRQLLKRPFSGRAGTLNSLHR
jgi:hypothetical protein